MERPQIIDVSARNVRVFPTRIRRRVCGGLTRICAEAVHCLNGPAFIGSGPQW